MWYWGVIPHVFTNYPTALMVLSLYLYIFTYTHRCTHAPICTVQSVCSLHSPTVANNDLLSLSACHTLWHMSRQAESSLPVPFPTLLSFTCEYPACIRWLWVGEPRAKLQLYAQLCRRTVFTRHPRACITSAEAINTQSKVINLVLQGHTHSLQHTHTMSVHKGKQRNMYKKKKKDTYIYTQMFTFIFPYISSWGALISY